MVFVVDGRKGKERNKRQKQRKEETRVINELLRISFVNVDAIANRRDLAFSSANAMLSTNLHTPPSCRYFCGITLAR
jgi:hypothetical protein